MKLLAGAKGMFWRGAEWLAVTLGLAWALDLGLHAWARRP